MINVFVYLVKKIVTIICMESKRKFSQALVGGKVLGRGGEALSGKRRWSVE